MFNSYLRFPFPSFFFHDRIFLNLTFLVESVFFLTFFSFFLGRKRFCTFFTFLFSFINSHLRYFELYPVHNLHFQSRRNKYSILDCVFSDKEKTFYILDMMWQALVFCVCPFMSTYLSLSVWLFLFGCPSIYLYIPT